MSSTAFATPSTRDLAVERALEQRYREAIPGVRAIGNETLATLLNHRSVRGFLPDALEEGTLELIVAAAQSASTSSNVQAWSLVAVEDKHRKASLAALAGNQKHINDAPLLLLWIADLARVSDIAARREVELDAIDFTESFLIATIDAALAAQNAFVAAESLGLGAVYVGAIRNKPLEVAEIIGLPERSYAVFGIAIGYPDPEKPTSIKPRLPQQAVLHRERYDLERQRDAIRRHDLHTGAFREEQKLDPLSWSDLVLGRLRTVEALKGRHVLRDVLARLGLPLK